MPSMHLDDTEANLVLDRLGDYEILCELGQGGMGIVYHARQESLDRDVALKVIRPQLAMDPRLMARFRREYTVHAGLSHPNIVKFYDAGETDGLSWYAMEYLDAVPLDEVVKDRGATQEFSLVTRVAEALAVSLSYLHPKGILHRDIKPGNVMIERGTDRVVLMDFGLVKPKDVTALTREGRTVGSPRYMSPEMLEGRASDPRTDIYQVGVTLYQLATGRFPYDGTDLVTLAAAIMAGQYPPPRRVNPIVSEPLESLIANCLARDLEDRYASAEALTDDIRRMRSGLSVARLDVARQAEQGSISDSLPPGAASSGSSPSGALPSGSISTGSGPGNSSRTGSASVSMPGRSSSPLPRVSSTSMDLESLEGRRVPLFPMLALLVVLCPLVYSYFGFGQAVDYRADGVEAIPGVRAALVRWRGQPAYPSRVVLQQAGTDAAAQTVLGPAPDAQGRHCVEIDTLEPGRPHRVQVLFPDGRVSLPHDLPPVAADGPELEKLRVRYLDDGVHLDLVVAPPCRATLRYRDQDALEERSVTGDYLREGRLVLPPPPPDGTYREVTLELEAVGARTVLELEPFRGEVLRLEDFARRVEEIDMEAVIRKLNEAAGEDRETLRRLARALLEVPGLDESLRVLRERHPLRTADATAWRLYRALRKLESVDAWLRNRKLEPVLRLSDTYRDLVAVSWPDSVAPGSLPLVDREPGVVKLGGDVTSMEVHGGTGRDRMILSIYTATSQIGSLEDHHGQFVLDEAPPPGGRAALAVRIRNLAPELRLRVTLNGSEPLDLYNTAASFPGTYWAQVHGSELDHEAIWRHSDWIVLEFPAALLRPGRNTFRAWAEVHDGGHATHLVDLYDLVLWPRAPAEHGRD